MSKDCTNDDLKEFLSNKGVDAVAVETLTKDEVLPNVRRKTFKITVTPAQYEMALQPEVWPYRVAVRHFRAPRRTEGNWDSQSGRAGGLVDRGDQAGGHVGGGQHQAGDQQSGGGAQQPRGGGQHLGGGSQYPVGHSRRRQSQSQQMKQQSLPDPVQISNLIEALAQLGSMEVSTH